MMKIDYRPLITHHDEMPGRQPPAGYIDEVRQVQVPYRYHKNAIRPYNRPQHKNVRNSFRKNQLSL